VQPPVPMLETTSIRSMETVLRTEPNAISILARDVVAELEAAGHWGALPYPLRWSLPPVSFFTTKDLGALPMVTELKSVVVRVAQGMQTRRARP
jgi:hypothetical protein